MSKTLSYKNEFYPLTEEENETISDYLTSKNKSSHFTFRGMTLKASMCEIFNTQGNLKDEKDEKRQGYLREWGAEQELLKKQSPEEKAFRNYRCMFASRYLLQVGYTNYLGAWKGDWFELFDKEFSKKEPEKLKEITDMLVGFFNKNPDSIWADKEMYNRFLPNEETLADKMSFKNN